MSLLTKFSRFLEEQIVLMDLSKIKLLGKVIGGHYLKPLEMATIIQ